MIQKFYNNKLYKFYEVYEDMQNMFDGVQLFVEVVEAGGFAKAGKRLSLTRSTIGKAIARLEMRLGVQLFQRTTRVQSLTEDGQQYYERCLRAIKELRAGEAMLEQGRREVAGRLHVSLPVLFGRQCVAPILRTYAREHPQLELELNFSDHHVDLIADGFDLRYATALRAMAPHYAARRLGNQRKILDALHRLTWPQEANPTHLQTSQTTTCSPTAAMTVTWPGHFPDATGALVDIPITSRLRCNDLEVIADTAVDGMGVAWLLYWLLMERMQRGELIGIWGIVQVQ